MQKCPGVESNQAGKAESCKGCPNASICASAKLDEDIKIIKEKLKPFKYILAVLSGKGGVGKSTVTRNLSSSIARMGYKTLILDFDLSGPSIPRLTKTENDFIYNSDEDFNPIFIEKNLSAISVGHLETNEDAATVFSSNIKNRAIKKILLNCNFDTFDILIIDTPPNITEEHLALANYIKPHGCVVVTTPQNLSLNDVRRQISFCKKVEITILGIIENMANFICPNCKSPIQIYEESMLKNFCYEEGVRHLGSIPLMMKIAKDSDSGNPANLEIFDTVAEEVCTHLKA